MRNFNKNSLHMQQNAKNKNVDSEYKFKKY